MNCQAVLPFLPVLAPAEWPSDAAAFEKKLRKAALRGEPIAIGTVTDPYQPAERRHGVVRSLLETFARVEGLDISITTRSPLILRDLDLLVDLDRRHSVSVQVGLTAVDPDLARRLEPHAPAPEARLVTVRALADEGITTSVFCGPVMPGINDGERVLRPLLEAAGEAGAYDVRAYAADLRPAARGRLLPWLTEELPWLVPFHHQRNASRIPPGQDRLLATFRRLRLEHGFPRPVAGRG